MNSYWTGLGQTADSILSPLPTDYMVIKLPDGELHKFPDGQSFEVVGNDGSYYYQDISGYWRSVGSAAENYISCWGDAIGGGWKCEDGSSGGDWYTSPASRVKQKAQSAAATAATQTATQPATQPATTTPGAPQPQPQPGFFDSIAQSMGVTTGTAQMIVIGGGLLVLVLVMGRGRK